MTWYRELISRIVRVDTIRLRDVLMHNRIVKRKYQVFTPQATVDSMLSLLRRRTRLFGKSFLENSCGDGRFVLRYVSMYVESCLKEGLSWDVISKGLGRDIVGYELDKRKLNRCRRLLDEELKKLGCQHKVLWNLINEDFLRAEVSRRFDFIVGNPPYLSYWDIPADDRAYIRDHFQVCKRGLWDYCFAFIEKSLSLLDDREGQFCYVIPSSIFKTRAAKGLRDALVEHLACVEEYASGQVFEGVLTSAAIVYVDNEDVSQSVKYRNHALSGNCEDVDLHRSILKNASSWCFSSQTSSGGKRRFGDYFRVSSSVATLCNAAFVLKGWQKSGQEYVEDSFSGERIEASAVRRAARPRCCGGAQEQYIIFPYSYNKDSKHWDAWSESEFRQQYPNAFKHLSKFKDQLDKRDSDKGAVWYEYGRSQALSSVCGDKLLISQVVTNSVNVHWLHDAELPYSGYYIQPKGALKLSTAEKVLKSQAFVEYAKSVGVRVNGNSIRLTTTNILDFTW